MYEVSQVDIDTFCSTIGKNVMRLRKENGMTPLDLALAIGLKSVGFISVAERYHNKKYFNLEHLYKIAVALDVSIPDFFSDIIYPRFSITPKI